MKEVQTQTVTLPAPISANDLWRPVSRGRNVSIIKTAAYAAWITEAGMKLNRQNPGCVKGPYALTLILQDGLRLDLDNAIKATSDLLQTHGVIENDKLCREIHARWSPLVVGCQVMVTSTRALGIATRESEV